MSGKENTLVLILLLLPDYVTMETVRLTGAGASFPSAIYQTWLMHYKAERAEFVSVNVSYDSVGSGRGKYRLKTNDPPVDFIGTDSPLGDEDYDVTPDAAMFPVLVGALVIGYHVPGVKGLNLSMTALVGIFSGNITHWDDYRLQVINPGVTLPSAKIMLIARRNASGTTAHLTSHLSAISRTWNMTYGTFDAGLDVHRRPVHWGPGVIDYFAASSTAVSTLIQSLQFSIGYMSHEDSHEAEVDYFNLENSAGNFVPPSDAHIGNSITAVGDRRHRHLVPTAGEDPYPLSLPTYLAVRLHTWADCATATELYRYVTWLSTDPWAHKDAQSAFFVTMPTAVFATIKENVLDEMTCAGTPVQVLVARQMRAEEISLEKWRLPVYIGVPLAVFVLAVMAAVMVYQQVKFNKALLNNAWKISRGKISFFNRDRKLRRSRKSMKSAQRSRQSSLPKTATSSTPTLCDVTIGTYHGETVCLRDSTLVTNYRFSIAKRKELLVLQDKAHHTNVARFYGLCEHGDVFSVVTEHCSRVLQDVLQNDDFNLDDNFKYSMASDVATGVKFLHSIGIVHGSLTSEVCVIDHKWNIKVSDWLHGKLNRYLVTRSSIFSSQRSSRKPNSIDTQNARKNFWTAPELLAISPRGGREELGKKCDTYSFGILLMEIFSRVDPYDELCGELSPAEILVKVVREGLRPALPVCYSPELRGLTNACWTGSPASRPDFRHILKVIGAIRPTDKGVVDCMMEAMENYTIQLEDKVEERTMELEVALKSMENLLHQMLPPSIADSLMKGDVMKAETFDDVTIFFSDIVGFTSLSAGSGPMDIVNLLNDLYTTFDAVLDKHDVYKVETIGDAYMVSSGLPHRNGIEHAGHIATMALQLAVAASQFVIRHRPGEKLKLRAGIHTGACAAGVVGIKMPRYCLFGDTVNTASRMESTSVEMKIQLSEHTISRLEKLGGYVYQSRGKISVKGKGDMQTYWLHGKHEFEDTVPPEFTRQITETV